MIDQSNLPQKFQVKKKKRCFLLADNSLCYTSKANNNILVSKKHSKCLPQTSSVSQFKCQKNFELSYVPM